MWRAVIRTRHAGFPRNKTRQKLTEVHLHRCCVYEFTGTAVVLRVVLVAEDGRVRVRAEAAFHDSC